MDKPSPLAAHEGRWQTEIGGWFSGERVVYRGQDLHVDLKDLSWLELYLYGITGRRFDEAQMKVLTAVWTYTSFPDVRLWNNRVTALAGTARSTATLALAAGTAVSEASIYGHRPNTRSIDFFIRTKKAMDEGAELETLVRQELKQHRVIYGYGRPLSREDERNPHFLALLKETGLDQGPHLKMALEIENFLKNGRWRMQLNITGLDAAVCADLGLTPRQHHLFMTMCFLAGMPPCFLDTNEREEGIFLPISCASIEYEGVASRKW